MHRSTVTVPARYLLPTTVVPERLPPGSMPYSVRAVNLLFLRSWAPSMQQGVPNHRKERGHKHVCCLRKGDEMNDAD